MIGKNHNGRVRGIDWFEDDTGFTTVGEDGGCYYHDLQEFKQNGGRIQDKDFNVKKAINFTGFNDVANIPGFPYDSIAVGGSNYIYRVSDGNKQGVDAGAQINQISMMHSGKIFFLGVSDETKTGSIQVWKFPMEKTNAV